MTDEQAKAMLAQEAKNMENYGDARGQGYSVNAEMTDAELARRHAVSILEGQKAAPRVTKDPVINAKTEIKVEKPKAQPKAPAAPKAQSAIPKAQPAPAPKKTPMSLPSPEKIFMPSTQKTQKTDSQAFREVTDSYKKSITKKR